MSCEICQIQQTQRSAGKVIDLGPDWGINPYIGPGNRPRWVIQANRHVDSLAKLHDGELASMGRSIGHAIRAIRKRDKRIEQVYVLSFNETPPGHPHVHLVPRFVGEVPNPYSLGDNIQLKDVDYQFEVCQKLGKSAEQIDSGIGIVSSFRNAISFWNTWISPYRLFTRASVKSSQKRFDAGEKYVLTWLALLLALLAISIGIDQLAVNASTKLVIRVVVSSIGFFRLLDIAIYSFGILLTTYKSALQSVARSLILFSINLVEVILVATILLLATGNDLTVAFLNSVSLVTSSSSSLPPNALGAFVLLMPAAVTLEVFALGIGMIVGKVGETFIDQSR